MLRGMQERFGYRVADTSAGIGVSARPPSALAGGRHRLLTGQGFVSTLVNARAAAMQDGSS